jgi:hypothetical protein
MIKLKIDSFGSGVQINSTRPPPATAPSSSTNACSILGAEELSKVRAPPKECKFFLWTVLLGRVWTAARRVRHGLQDDDSCTMCLQAAETPAHILLSCVYSREFWYLVLQRLGLHGCPVANVCSSISVGNSTPWCCSGAGFYGLKGMRVSSTHPSFSCGRASCFISFRERPRHGRQQASLCFQM